MRRLGRLLVAMLSLVGIAAHVSAQTNAIAIHVKETAGIRRSAFPATARVPLPRGAFTDGTKSTLKLNGTVVPMQLTAITRWADNSVQWADVDFNASPGPNEALDFTFEYGNDVDASPASRGLTVTELGDSLQVGSVRFTRLGSPLLASVKYRDEAIGTGMNGFFVAGADGQDLPLSGAADLTLEVVKHGPLVVALRYTGTLASNGAQMPFTIDVEMPSSKSWIKLSADVQDPQRQLRGLSLATPLALGPLPWVWDIGTGRWTYGQLRTASDAYRFERPVGSRQWTVTASANGREQIAEQGAAPDAAFAGWWHLSGAKEVVAFAAEGLDRYAGTVRLDWAASGQTRVAITPPTPTARHHLSVYEHFVATPVQIGAATAPPAILAPLAVSLDRTAFTQAGVAAPR